MKRNHCVYILASRSRALYTGVTNDLETRVQQHREGRAGSFTSRYRIHRLVYFEVFGDVRDAIKREKQIKHWMRMQRMALIESANPSWRDLAEERFPTYPRQEKQKQILRTKSVRRGGGPRAKTREE